MIEHPYEPNTPEWRKARRGVITASRAKDVRRTDGLTEQQRTYVAALKSGQSDAAALDAAGYKKKPTAEAVERAINGTLQLQFTEAAHTYAKDLARERCGGQEPDGYEGLSQRIGHEEEQFAAIEYVAKTGLDVSPAYFITTDDGKFGVTLDRWVGQARDAGLEAKTMVSSATLFKAMVDGDISEYRDQCIFGLWMLSLKWTDLCLWCPDLQALHVIRITRNENEIQALEDDLMEFERLVTEYETKLRAKLNGPAQAPAPAAKPTQAAPDMDAPWELPTTDTAPAAKRALAAANF